MRCNIRSIWSRVYRRGEMSCGRCCSGVVNRTLKEGTHAPGKAVTSAPPLVECMFWVSISTKQCYVSRLLYHYSEKVLYRVVVAALPIRRVQSTVASSLIFLALATLSYTTLSPSPSITFPSVPPLYRK